MDYISNVFISASTYWVFATIIAIIYCVICKLNGKTYSKALYRGAKLYLVVFCIGLVVGLFSPSNTYKFKSERISNPAIETEQAPELDVDIVIKRDADTKRKENFDNLTNWKSRVE